MTKPQSVWSDAELDLALTRLRADVGDEPVQHEAARNLLEAALAHGQPIGDAVEHRRGHHVTRWVVAAAIVGVLAAAGLVAGPLLDPGGSKAAAATLLSDSAARLIAHPVVVPAGQFLHTTEHSTMIDSASTPSKTFAWQRSATTEYWVPSDPNGIWTARYTKGTDGHWLNATAAEAAAAGVTSGNSGPEEGQWSSSGGGFCLGSNRPQMACAGDWSWPTASWMAALPRDPTALWTLLQKAAAGSKWRDEAAFLLASDLLNSGVVPNDLTAAIYKALADNLPQLTYVQHVTTAAGRTGDAIGLLDTRYNPLHFQIIIDPQTGAYLGFRSTLAASNHGDTGTTMPIGTVYSSCSITSTLSPSGPNR